MDPSRKHGGVGVGSRFKRLIWRKVRGRGGFSSSLSSSEEETIIGTKEGTNFKDGLSCRRRHNH
jgi:hypothetical protein